MPCCRLFRFGACALMGVALLTGCGDAFKTADELDPRANASCGTSHSISDTFDGPEHAPFWLMEGSGNAFSYQDGALTIAAGSAHSHALNSRLAVRLRESAVTFEVANVTAASNGGDFGFSLIGKDEAKIKVWSDGSGLFYEQQDAGGALDQSTAITYESEAQRFWQLREHGDEVFFETSPDGASWEEQHRSTTPDYAQSMLPRIWVLGAAGGAISGSVADFNHGLSAPWCAPDFLTDTFDGESAGLAWNTSSTGTCTIKQGEGRVRFSVASPDGGGHCAYATRSAYRLTNNALTVHFGPAANKAYLISRSLALVDVAGGWAQLMHDASDGTMTAASGQGARGEGNDSSNEGLTFDAQKELWWQIREEAGTLYFATSTDGKTFTPKSSTPAFLDTEAIRISIALKADGHDSGAAATIDLLGYNTAP